MRVLSKSLFQESVRHRSQVTVFDSEVCDVLFSAQADVLSLQARTAQSSKKVLGYFE